MGNGFVAIEETGTDFSDSDIHFQLNGVDVGEYASNEFRVAESYLDVIGCHEVDGFSEIRCAATGL
ncbi:hypothetical protein HVMH_1174 [Hydrogenovibrio marinus]|nr:hypothetical protein HVMH_1174 [Hydrogenovibrio marinus]